MFKIEPEEELIKKTKPHAASFLSSPAFVVGALFLLLGFPKGLFSSNLLFRGLLVGAGLFFIGVSYVRRVLAYTLYFTDLRVISDYSLLRKNYREIHYDKIIDVQVLQDIFGKAFGYAEVWIFGKENGWVIGRMRGVRLGDTYIIVNKAWKKEVANA